MQYASDRRHDSATGLSAAGANATGAGATPGWVRHAFLYHLYPLGLLGAPERNDFTSPPTPRLETLHAWIPHLQHLGANTVLLGPVFESSTHGYDTVDLLRVDRRLGTWEDLKRLVDAFHRAGLRVLLDAVFHHVGRDHAAFAELRERGPEAPRRHWFAGVDFARRSPLGDPFDYHAWNGCHDLVKLELHQPDVRAHLFEAVDAWFDDLGVDGLRLDAADVLELGFVSALSERVRGRWPEAWLVGEVIHGDYRRWADAGLHGVTNYEAYKALWSSLNDGNYFELAHTLDRQFGPGGRYRDLALYAFADNHDVMRVASRLNRPDHLHVLHLALMTMPGVPSVYYGSEWGIEGRKGRGTDAPLRPALELAVMTAEGDGATGPGQGAPHPALAETIRRLAGIRAGSEALRRGDYETVAVQPKQLAYVRRSANETVVVALNADAEPARLELALPGQSGRLVDLLAPGERFPIENGRVRLEPLWPGWGRVLRVEG